LNDDIFSKFVRRLIWPLILGALVFVGLSIYGDFEQILSTLSAMPIWVPLTILLLSLVNYFVRMFKWHYFLGRLDIKVGVGLSMTIFFSGLIMSISPAKLGEAIKSLLLKSTVGTPISRSLPIVMAERLTDFLALVILSAYGVVIYNYGGWVLIVISALLVGFLALVSWQSMMFRLIGFGERLPAIKKHADRLHSLYESTRALLTFRSLLITTLLSVLSWWMECLGLYLVFFGIAENSIELGPATFIYSFSTILGAATMLPGGLLVTEGSMTSLLAWAGIAPAAAVVSTLLVRAGTLWFSVVLGAAVLFANRAKFFPKERIPEPSGKIDTSQE
jgi:glycosyltransferase 2 family protein